MGYRIEVSKTRKGFVQVHFPGRMIALEATEHAGPVWQVSVADDVTEQSGIVAVWAESPGDAVWRVAQATVRAVTGLAGADGTESTGTYDGEGQNNPATNDSLQRERT